MTNEYTDQLVMNICIGLLEYITSPVDLFGNDRAGILTSAVSLNSPSCELIFNFSSSLFFNHPPLHWKSSSLDGQTGDECANLKAVAKKHINIIN